ncbi:unnamed protein product [Cyprideis torosa]|uniref:Uncharacterized protein n=1 Tax=Cyprideis torosa TaxID=163714 RepID=A0A7R8ZGQ6_9CRUS|nr:unnamed protein product [Cyprideis torosa]CAG0880802.1 unnamed protein product [Cyprideis torosa]
MLWRSIGYLLGIEDEFNVCKDSLEDTRLAVETIAELYLRPQFAFASLRTSSMMEVLRRSETDLASAGGRSRRSSCSSEVQSPSCGSPGIRSSRPPRPTRAVYVPPHLRGGERSEAPRGIAPLLPELSYDRRLPSSRRNSGASVNIPIGEDPSQRRQRTWRRRRKEEEAVEGEEDSGPKGDLTGEGEEGKKKSRRTRRGKRRSNRLKSTDQEMEEEKVQERKGKIEMDEKKEKGRLESAEMDGGANKGVERQFEVEEESDVGEDGGKRRLCRERGERARLRSGEVEVEELINEGGVEMTEKVAKGDDEDGDRSVLEEGDKRRRRKGRGKRSRRSQEKEGGALPVTCDEERERFPVNSEMLEEMVSSCLKEEDEKVVLEETSVRLQVMSLKGKEESPRGSTTKRQDKDSESPVKDLYMEMLTIFSHKETKGGVVYDDWEESLYDSSLDVSPLRQSSIDSDPSPCSRRRKTRRKEGCESVDEGVQEADSEDDTYGSQSRLDHVLEVYDFPKEFTTKQVLEPFFHQTEYVHIKWVDDTHAAVIFDTAHAARTALGNRHPFFKLRPMTSASPQTIEKLSRIPIHKLQVPKERPVTTGLMARRMIAKGLGIRDMTPHATQMRDKRLLEAARIKKMEEKASRFNAWEGC